MSFAKEVVQLLSTRFQAGSSWIGRSEKNICGQADCVRERWIWEDVVWSFVAIFRKYDLSYDCYSGTEIGR